MGRTVPRVTISLRVEAELLRRLEAVLESMRQDYPTFRLSISDAARVALTEGVTVLERRPPKGRELSLPASSPDGGIRGNL